MIGKLIRNNPLSDSRFHGKLRKFLPGNLRLFSDEFVPEQCDGRKLTVCESCDTIKVCLSNSDNALNPTQRCPDATPYCSSEGSAIGADCRAQPDAGCSVTDAQNSFRCTGSGFYPDANSCQVYHYCEKEGAESDSYDCPEGYKYNTRTNHCQWSLFPCNSVVCNPNNKKVFSSFPGDNSYYVFCQYDYADKPAAFLGAHVFACGKGSTFNENSASCEFRCPRIGLFVNTANPRQYYQCYRVGGRLQYKTNVCRADQIFDEDERRCVAVSGTTEELPATTKPGMCVRRRHVLR